MGLKQEDLGKSILASVRSRPECIVVGEVRGTEAMELLKSMNTGCNGTKTTAHASNPYPKQDD